jgi:hypothetical protein
MGRKLQLPHDVQDQLDDLLRHMVALGNYITEFMRAHGFTEEMEEDLAMNNPTRLNTFREPLENLSEKLVEVMDELKARSRPRRTLQEYANYCYKLASSLVNQVMCLVSIFAHTTRLADENVKKMEEEEEEQKANNEGNTSKGEVQNQHSN